MSRLRAGESAPMSRSPDWSLGEIPRPDRCVVLGVLNVTPDSFSDGGRFQNVDDAIAHGVRM
ncbi:MAG: dihydropteroate synthase, partial [Pseudonocardiales bacterium]|nr:dihydropteroate synthase [Pseudonocardiales bacterium]